MRCDAHVFTYWQPTGTVNISISGMWLLSWPLHSPWIVRFPVLWLLSWPLHSPRIFRCFGELLSVDSIWFPREVYSKSLVGPLAPGSLESAESYLYFAIDKWWQNTVLYSDTPLQQVLNENVVKIKINTSKRPNSKLSEIICWYPNWSHETIPFFREDSSWTSWA